MAEVTVVDKGVGVDADSIDELVGDFSQGDPSATRRFGGLGLGLAMVDRIVRAHEGELRMESLPGKGSTFAIILPMEERGGTRRRRRPRAKGKGASAKRGRRPPPQGHKGTKRTK